MITHADGITLSENREDLVPVKILRSHAVEGEINLTTPKAPCVSFKTENCAIFSGKGAWILLDFGREICGGVRIVTRSVKTDSRIATWRLTFGESVSEACSTIGENNAGNDHSPRDFEVVAPFMSDLTFGQTGFRFLRMELKTDATVFLKNIFAVSVEPDFPREATITTNDTRLNSIIQTAARTLKLCFQNGYIWDGIKRDRLVWCGDLHPEIITSLYLYGDTPNIRNALNFLREETPADKWVNNMPPYSAWWVINLCDYCAITDNMGYYNENRQYVHSIMKHINSCIDKDGNYCFTDTNGSETFLDWSTYHTPDAPYGSAAVYYLAAQKVLDAEENPDCRQILAKLKHYIEADTNRKPTRAFQVLAGRKNGSDLAFLEKDDASDFSTFMAYYILTAMADLGGSNMLDILKSYYGAMLDRGATTFWEDFDMQWLSDSGRIDQLPAPGQKDIHGDFGRFCYTQFRHSLCHGWSSGVLAFIIEHILGIKIKGNTVSITPHLSGLTLVQATLPVADGWLNYSYHNGKLTVSTEGNVKIM